MTTTVRVDKNRTIPNRATLNLWPETGRLLGLGKNATYAAAARGEIPTLRFGGKSVVPRAALEKLLDVHLEREGQTVA